MLRQVLLPAAILALLVALSGAATAQAPQVPDGLGIRLIEVPVDRVEDPRARSYVIDHVAPGTTIERRFEVSNGADQPATINLYAALAEIDTDAFRPAVDREQNELSSWITVDPPTVEMLPRGRITALMRISVPAEAEDGERYAVVLAEQRAPEDIREGQVGVTRRVGLRIYLSVGPGPEPITDFQIESMRARRTVDGPMVTALVANAGGRALDLRGRLELKDGPDGLSIAPIDASTGSTIVPGATGEVDILVGQELPAGPWLAELRLASGVVVREGSEQLTFPDEVEQPTSPASVVDDEASDGAIEGGGIIVEGRNGSAAAAEGAQVGSGEPDRGPVTLIAGLLLGSVVVGLAVAGGAAMGSASAASAVSATAAAQPPFTGPADPVTPAAGPPAPPAPAAPTARASTPTPPRPTPDVPQPPPAAASRTAPSVPSPP